MCTKNIFFRLRNMVARWSVHVMFSTRKRFRVKARNSAKNSERKRCRNLVQSTFDMSEDVLEIVFPSKCLFEVAKLNTPSCPLDGRADVDVFVYFIDKEPIFFDYSSRIFPTVYCAWKCPSIVPTVATWPPVLPKLIGGADLMLPGVVGPEQGGADFSILRKGQICAVNVVGNRAAVSIGVSLLSGGEMIAGRMKGKGIVILHTHKDLLWEAGSKLEPPFLAFSEPKEHPKSISQPEQGSRQPQMLLSVEKLDLKLESKLDLDSGESDTVVGDEITTHGEMTAGEMTPGETTAGETTAGETTPGETTPLETTPGGNGSELLDQMPPNADGRDTNVPMAMSDIGPPLSQDDLIFHCFVSALKGGKLHKDQLPMLTSAFFRGHMLVECPKGCRLDVKKTTYKKLSVFLQAMCDEGIIEVKEMSKGVDSITDVNTKHPMVKRYTPPETLSSFFDEEETLLKPSSAEKKGNGKISVVEMYIPSAGSLPIFQHFGFNKSSILLPSQVREVLTDYIKREELACVHDKRMVRLGPVLTSLLHQKGVEDLEEMSWNELMKRFMSELRPAYKLMLANGEEFVRKGRAPSVKLTVVLRSGNKKVTVVSNLEHYGINCDSFASRLQKMAAASTSVSEIPSGQKIEKIVSIQGDATKLLTQQLTDVFGLPSKYIEQESKIKKKGK